MEEFVTHVSAAFDCEDVLVDESSPTVLKYKTPKFKAVATVEVPSLQCGKVVKVGWIQTCTSLLFVNEYGSYGMTSWELPELVSGSYKMVSDADGKHYPWYGARNEVMQVRGPTLLSTPVTVSMHDIVHPQVTWYMPVVHDSGSQSRCPRLTKVSRCQRFLTYLVVQSANLPSSSLHHEGRRLCVVKAVLWSVEATITVDPSKPLGKRVTFIGPARQHDPEIIDAADAPSLTDNALRPPNANSSQTLTWWPADVNKDPTVVVKARVTTPSTTRAIETYQHAHSRHAQRLHSLYSFSTR